jgi:hypothetical protein
MGDAEILELEWKRMAQSAVESQKRRPNVHGPVAQVDRAAVS